MFVSIRVYPNANKNAVVGFSDGVWLVRVSAPPVKGKANKELISFLSEVLNVGKSSVSIVQGHTSRSKLLAVDGLTQQEITKQLSSSFGASSK